MLGPTWDKSRLFHPSTREGRSTLILLLTTIFQVNEGYSVCLLLSPPFDPGKEPSKINGTVFFYWLNALPGTQPTVSRYKRKRWLGLIVNHPSYDTGLLKKGCWCLYASSPMPLLLPGGKDVGYFTLAV